MSTETILQSHAWEWLFQVKDIVKERASKDKQESLLIAPVLCMF